MDQFSILNLSVQSTSKFMVKVFWYLYGVIFVDFIYYHYYFLTRGKTIVNAKYTWTIIKVHEAI